MRLAAQTHCTLEELGDRMSAEEFGLWEVFNEEEPIGPTAFALAVAQIRTAIANGPLQPPQGRKSFSAIDFYPERWQPEPRANAGPSMEQIAGLFGAKG